jgi:esterase/lipase
MNMSCNGQERKNLYFIPGQGSDKRIFDSLEIDSSFNIQFLEYGTPPKNISLKEFSKELASKIDTTTNFSLIGVSLGGMICVEISEILNPEYVIIISSAKNRNDLPFRYRFQSKVPLYEIFPGFVLFAGAKILQPIVEPDRNKNIDTFKNMLYAKNSKYIKRTIRMLMKWNRDSNTTKIIHIHGDNDHTIPLKNIKEVDIIIKNGSHMMTLTRAKELSRIINEILIK